MLNIFWKMSSCALIVLGLVLCFGLKGVTAEEFKRRELLAILLNTSRYDSSVVPDFDEEYPTNVTIQVTIHDLHSISETAMEYSLDVYLRMWWRDDRLDFSDKSNKTKLELDTKNIGNGWQPDIFFENEKRAAVHQVTTTNNLMHIQRNGTVIYSVRLSLALSCTMLLQYYPFDSQRCPLLIQSFGYTKDNINLDWYSAKPVVAENLEMPQFKLAEDDIQIFDFISQYSQTGTFSTLKAELVLTRKVGFYFLQVFVPAVLLVVLSWVSFWVDANAVPARVSLGVTCVLTMTTQSSGIRQSLPPVSYVKAIDVWMFVCLLFVFAALLEFAYVNVLLRRKVPERSEPYEMDQVNEQENSNDQNIEGKKTQKAQTFRSICKLAPDAKTKAKRVDIISRYMFPATFALFLFLFFMVCGLAPTPDSDDV